MSHSAYNKEWKEAQALIENILHLELNDKQKEVKDRSIAFQIIATLFVQYGQILHQIERCYDQIVHPQKRLLLRNVLDSVVGRILELKQEMVNLEFSEYHYFDDVLSDLKLMPTDLQICIPKYYIMESENILKDRNNFLMSLRSQISKSKPKVNIGMPLETAILLLQRHERARQGRLRAKFMRDIRAQEEEDLNPVIVIKAKPNPRDAAILIQKIWRGYYARKYANRMRADELIWLGMEPINPHFITTVSNPSKMAKRVESLRRISQRMNAAEYEQALINIKEKIRQTEGVDMQERMIEQIRQWFLECRDSNGIFPDYPPEEAGGSLWVFKEKPPEMLAAEEAAKLEAEDKKKNKDKPKIEQKKKKKDEPEGWLMSPSLFLEPLQIDCKTYDENWKFRDESDNFFQRHEDEIIKADKRVELDLDIRVHVDEMMRQELRNLKIAIDKEKQKRISKKKIKKPKGKKNKGKKMKDLTPDRSVESLYEELVVQDIIKNVPKTSLDEYFGEYSYLGQTLRSKNIEPQPSLSDVKQLATLYGILPLGNPRVHMEAPMVRSLLLAGPSGTGKRMLVNVICTETGANLFDLTAANIAGKYMGKPGTRLLMSMVFKVARLLQPSVILVNECERMFIRKVPKADRTEPKRLKSYLPKAIKTIQSDQRILIIGCTMAPFDCPPKMLGKMFDKIILVPRPDYASRFLIWRVLIVKAGGLITDSLDLSSLSKISDGYTMGMMEIAAKEVLTERRKAQLDHLPLETSEFIGPLSRMDPVFTEEEDAYKTWYRKTPLGRKRAIAIQEQAELEAKGAKGGKKRGKK